MTGVSIPQVVHVFDGRSRADAVSEALLLAGPADRLVCAGARPAALAADGRAVHVSMSSLRAGRGGPVRPLVHAGAAMVCWSVSAAAAVSRAFDEAATPIAVRLTGPPTAGELRQLFSLARTDQTAAVCASDFIAAAVAAGNIPAAVRVIGPPADVIAPGDRPRLRESLRRRLGIAPDALVIAAPGAAGRASRHRLAVWAGAILRVAGVPAVVMLPHTGQDARREKDFARRAGFGPAACLVGAEVTPREFMAAADVAVLLTAGCAARPAAATAMLAGVPLVASDAGPTGLTDGQDALLVATDRPRAIARGVLRIVEDPLLTARLVASAKALARRRFDPATVRAAWAEVCATISRPRPLVVTP